MSNVENVCPQVLRGVTRELRRLAANPPSGIKLVLRDDDLTDVVALIDGPGEQLIYFWIVVMLINSNLDLGFSLLLILTTPQNDVTKYNFFYKKKKTREVGILLNIYLSKVNKGTIFNFIIRTINGFIASNLPST